LKLTFKYVLATVCVFYFLLFLFCKDFPFFQDNILFSAKIPYHFYENGFFDFPLPVNIDTGYPPLWSWLVKLSWTIFDQQLWVGHFICLPILIATAWFYLKIAKYFLLEKHLWLAALFLIIEPTYLAQSTMVGPDIFMVMAFMGSLYGIIYHINGVLILMTILLSMTSVRGAVFVFILFLSHLIFQFFERKSLNWKIILLYVPSAILFLSWMAFHYQSTGALLVRDGSPWKSHHQLANLKMVLVNSIITIWRFVDFGRIVLYGVLVFLIIKNWKSLQYKIKILLAWAFIPLLILVVVLCIRTNPILHRYFMVYFLLHSLLTIVLLVQSFSSVRKNIALALMAISLIFGHFWIYPNKDIMVQGWDASLAHLPYFELREQMLNFINEENIPANQILTAFPNVNGTYYSNLSKEPWNFKSKHQISQQSWQYVMESNVMNDFMDDELEYLQSKRFQLVQSYSKGGVYMNLYKRYSNNPDL